MNNQKTQGDRLLPGIDIVTGLANVLNTEAIFYDVLSMFHQAHGKDAEKLNIAFINRDIETLKNVTHTLKGVSGSIAATELYNYVKSLDSILLLGDIEHQELPLLLDNIFKEIAIVLQGIESALIKKTALL